LFVTVCRTSRSIPEQNALPVPVRITTLTDSAASAWARVESKSSIISPLMAFRRSGRFKVIVFTGPVKSQASVEYLGSALCGFVTVSLSAFYNSRRNEKLFSLGGSFPPQLHVWRNISRAVPRSSRMPAPKTWCQCRWKPRALPVSSESPPLECCPPDRRPRKGTRPFRSALRRICGNLLHTRPGSFPARDRRGCADAPQFRLPRRNPSPTDTNAPRLPVLRCLPCRPATRCARQAPSARSAFPPQSPRPTVRHTDFQKPWKCTQLASCPLPWCPSAVSPPDPAIPRVTCSDRKS